MEKIMLKFVMATCLAGGSLILADRADAQVPVTDASNLAQAVQEVAQDVAAVEQLKAQLQQLQQTYAMFTNPTNILGMATSLENSTIENPMPAAAALNGLIGGQTSPSGVGETFYQQSHIYTPPAGSPVASELTENAQGIANIEGIASSNLAAIESRLQQLPNLEADLSAATSITQVDAINGRITAESQFVQGQQAQAANLQVLASEQQASMQEQQQEKFHQETNSFVSEMQ